MPPQPSSRVFQGVLLALVVFSIFQAGALREHGAVHSNDFKHIWAGARILADGGSPYDPRLMLSAARQYGFDSINPYVYLPATGLMMRPLAAMEFATAERVWFWLNLALVWWCVIAGPRLMRVERPWLAQAAGALFIVMWYPQLGGVTPFYRQMTAGQMSVALLAMLIGTIGWLARGRDLRAGALLGAAAAFKIAPLFLILVLAGMRRWRAAVAACATFGAIMMISMMWTGSGVHREAFDVIRQMGYGHSTWAELDMDFYRDPFNQSFNSFFHHMLTENPHTTPWFVTSPRVANMMTWAASIGILAALAGAIARARRRPYFGPGWTEAESSLFLTAVVVMLLLPSLMWDHYAVQTLAGLMWLAGSRHMIRRPLRGVGLLVVFAALAAPWHHLNPDWRAGSGILLMSLRLWGTLGLLWLLLADLRERMGERLG